MATTAAPSRANSSAEVRPMPCPAPVTRTLFPVNRAILQSSDIAFSAEGFDRLLLIMINAYDKRITSVY
ncbi:hypothetical protein [Sphingomonas sp. Leaf67]|uniref:hypothetical protein n=1 Tax=Sphingomonas sp. Leaf67 TaxID=1736230 RepID=UPI001F3340A0|nr:hypothetical protein [Sphingomonas sp. Leaf67]